MALEAEEAGAVKRYTRVGAAAARRRAAGGKRAVGRDSLSVADYVELKRELRERDQARCKCCGATTGIMDPEHAIPRSKGGADCLSNMWWSCRRCHLRKEVPYEQGRLKPIPLGGGHFRFEIWYGTDKRHIERVEVIRDTLEEARA